MTVAIAFVGGLVTLLLLAAGTRATMDRPVLARENYRGHRLPTAVGLLLVVAVIAVEGGRTLLWIAGLGDAPTTSARLLVLAAVVSFGFLGLVDDLLGDGGDRGLRGHARAALHGRLTTGFLKLAGGPAVALVLVAAADGSSRWRLLVDGAVVALAANVGNLFDRAPGRTIKVGLLAWVGLVAVGGTTSAATAAAVVAGAAAGLLPGDLRERFMLGDVGANALGAGLGMATVLLVAPTTRVVIAVILLALTLLSEVVSFSRVIAAVAPLRLLDGAGRRPAAR